jgi:uncharacterized protein YciI
VPKRSMTPSTRWYGAPQVESPSRLSKCIRVSEWIYFLHPPRDDFAATITDEEEEIWRHHFLRLQQLLSDGVLVLAGPTLGRINTGIAVFEAPDEETARAIMNDDPVVAGGYAKGELRPFRISLLRGGVPE